jgi:hypothetical protein
MKRNRHFVGDFMHACWTSCANALKKGSLAFVLALLLTSGEFFAQAQDRAALQQVLTAQKAAVEANPQAYSSQTRDVQFEDNALPQDICYMQHDPAGWVRVTSFISSGTAGGALDDGSSAQINLPFQFDFYGETFNSLFININGNVSFEEPYWEFSSTGFPISGFKMIAPFWADVDLRGAGEIWYKINDNSIYINWVGVGYYNSQSDLLNTFQLALSNGNDPAIGLGNNVAFHYGDMDWTTGSASGGTAGFGGTAATVGANFGNISNYFTLGRFDHAGTDYTDMDALNGVDYLDGQCVQFNVAGNQNLPPIAFGVPGNNILELCPNAEDAYSLSFSSPEANQITHTEISGIFDGLNIITNLDGEASIVQFSVSDNVPAGDYLLTFTATDNHPTNPQTTVVEITIRVNYELCPCQPSLEVSCPADVVVECSQELNMDLTGMPGISGNFCDENISVIYEDAIISCTPCGKVISRTWIITLGSFTEVCTQIITTQDTQGPEILNLESEINVQCLEEVPGFQDAIAVDACSGDAVIENWSSQTGEVESTCVASTAMGPGVDWAIWLPTLTSASGANFVFNEDGGHFDQFADGTAHMHGTVVNTINASEEFVVDLWFENKADWATWSAQGRNYKNDLMLACAVNNHTDWTYYEMVNGFSTLTGAGALEGTDLYLNHMPSSYYFGFQIGIGANNKNCEFGMSGWFTYEGFLGGEAISGHGDVNVDLECQPNLESDCIHHTSFTYLYRGIDGCGNATIAEQTINVNDTLAPVFVNCPESFTTECSTESIPVAEGVEAIDNCSGDILVEYLGEVSEGNACLTTLTRTWSATDLCGNRAECVQVITVIDTTAPVMSNLPEEETTAECNDVPAAAGVVLTDNCDANPTLVYNEERIDGDCPSNYTLVRTWYGYDQCQNETSVFTQTIHVVDTTAPVFDAYEFYTHIECNEIPSTITATDNCGDATVEIIEEMHQSGGCLGVLYRVYRATDACGNSTDVEQYIAIMDTTAPVATNAAEDTTIECGTEIPSYDPAFTDNCGSEVETQNSSTSETVDCVTTITEVYTATDYCGNTSSVTRVVTIVDTTAPIFVEFPSDLTISCEESIPAAELPAASDNCDSDINVEYNDEIVGGNCPQSYTVVRTFTATDDCGNEYSQAQSIHVLDETAPVFGEQSNAFTYECNTEIPVITPSASDNCSTVTLSYIDSEMQGNTCETNFVRVWTAADECGNTSEFAQNISIVDTTAPEISGESEIDRPCDDYAGVFVQVSDNCSSYNVEYTDEMVSGSCAGNIIRTYIATDSCGNASAAFTQIIHLGDAIAPVVVSQTENFTTECGAAGTSTCDVLCNPDFENSQVVAPGNWGLFNQTSVPCWMAIGSGDLIEVWGTGFDGVPAYSGLQFIELNSVSPSTVYQNFNATPGSTVAISFAHRGRAGIDVMSLEIGPVGGPYTSLGTFSAGTSQWNINAVNYTFPNNSQTNYAIRFNAVSSAGGPSVGNFIDHVTMCVVDGAQSNSIVPPVFADNCDNELEIDSTFTSVTEGCTTIETYTWTATDQCGNSTSASTVVTLVDTTNPYFTELPENITVNCDDAQVGFGQYSAADNCDSEVEVEVSEQILEGNCPQSYTIERTYRAMDNCGNQAVETRYVYVIDQTAPVFEEQDGSFTYECGEEISVVEPLANDNCGEVSLSYEDSELSGSTCQGLIIRTWTATDECGNSAEFNQYISIIDTQAPVVNDYTTEIEMPCDNISEEITISAEDCNEVIITFSDELVSGNCAGRIIRTYSVSDVCGNVVTEQVQQIINLIDATAPSVAVAPVDVEIECGEEVPSYNPSWTDNCADQEYLVETAFQQITEDECTTSIFQTWTAVDPCGNSTTVSRTITIVDSTAPVFTYVPSNEERDCNDEDSVSPAYADDNCSDVTIAHNDVIVPGQCPASYTIERTYTATDICGNSSTYTQIISVSDNTAPLWNESETSFTYECGAGVEVETPVAVDDCSLVAVSYVDGSTFEYGCTYAFERVWTAVDACGNTSVPFVQYISFEDTTEPVLSGCPEDLVLACDDNIPAPVQVSAFDTCDDDVQVYYEQTFIGDAPAEGSVADCNLITPVRPAGNPCGYPADWAMVMFGMTTNNRYYAVDGGSLVQYPDNTIHLTATMRSTTNPANGWTVDVTFSGNMDWETWSSQSFPTSFKDDCGGVGANHPSWHYYLMTPGANAELVGFGDFTGSMVNLTHAPSNNYFGFQLGAGANNYNAADNGFGGWFSYSGVFRASANAPLTNISGSGDFAFELDCCPDYEIVRQWTAVDCSGNSSTCMQTISFSSEVESSNGNEGQNVNFEEASSDEHLENEMGVSPNPTNSHTTFTFKVAKADKTSFEILDMTGKKVADLYSGIADAHEVYTVNYDVRNLAPGVYMFRLINGFDVKIDRLVVGK